MDYEKLNSDRLGESSASVRERVQAARERQRVRFGVRSVALSRSKGLPTSAQSQETLQATITCNSDMRVAEVRKFCKDDAPAPRVPVWAMQA